MECTNCGKPLRRKAYRCTRECYDEMFPGRISPDESDGIVMSRLRAPGAIFSGAIVAEAYDCLVCVLSKNGTVLKAYCCTWECLEAWFKEKAPSILIAEVPTS